MISPSSLRRQAEKVSPARRAAFLAQLPAEKAKRPRGMNKTEAAFAEHLQSLQTCGGILWFAFEAIRLNLGGGAWFKPDFSVIDKNGRLWFWEVKGTFWREAARVRIKVAAAKYPHFVFIAAQRDGSDWKYEEFRP